MRAPHALYTRSNCRERRPRTRGSQAPTRAGAPARLPPCPTPRRSNKAGGDPNIRYYHSYWKLPLVCGTALRIRVRPPVCRCWNFQLNNHWMESLDYRHHTVHTNGALATPDAGDAERYTIIVSHVDPNADASRGWRGNWIETVGHECGTMCFRWVAPRVEDALLPHPSVEVVRVEAL